jgi:penicillin-binding protein 2
LPDAKVKDPSWWDVAIAGMVDVANAPHGTARYYIYQMGKPPYTMAGKSGTAQVFTVAATERMRKASELAEHLRDHALFVAFAPVEDPKIAVAVIVENAPRGGSAYAGPIARKILDAYLLTPEQLAEQQAKYPQPSAEPGPNTTE